MKRHWFLTVTALIFMLLLTCCGAPNPPASTPPETTPPAISEVPLPPDQKQQKAEYKRITPQEAETMMSDDAVVLDVRTKEEFDEGHILNAVLLPDYEIEEKAESVIPDKNQTVLVYCRSGRRSEIASKKLIDMGYTAVFDFGGIIDWTGEIVVDDVTTQIDYAIIKSINSGIPELEFRIEGTTGKSHDRIEISKLTISDKDETFKQEFAGLSTFSAATEEDMYGLSFDDWNFDGYLDVSLWKYLGGSLMNAPHYYWLWDTSTGKFAANTQLEEISDYTSVSADIETNQIKSFCRIGFGEYVIQYYEYGEGDLTMVKSETYAMEQEKNAEDKYVWRTITKELINGDMVITKDYYGDSEG